MLLCGQPSTSPPICSYKVRKLEFLLADALEKGCDTIVTCGGIQSNHARATAVASRQLGMQPHLLLRWQGEIVRRFCVLILFYVQA